MKLIVLMMLLNVRLQIMWLLIYEKANNSRNYLHLGYQFRADDTSFNFIFMNIAETNFIEITALYAIDVS